MSQFMQELTGYYDGMGSIRLLNVPYLLVSYYEPPKPVVLRKGANPVCATCHEPWIEGAVYCVYCLESLLPPKHVFRNFI